MSQRFVDQWREVVRGPAATEADVVASITEEALNHYLAKHHENDRDRYRYSKEQTFDANGKVRTFAVTIEATAPISIDLPPFAPAPSAEIDALFADPDGWNPVEHRSPPEPGPYVPARGSGDPNVRVFCPRFEFALEWEKLDGGGTWEWKPAPISALAEAYLVLKREDDRYVLHLEPSRVRFDKASTFAIADETRRFLAGLGEADRAIARRDAEKFDDLLVIALNIVSGQFAPRLVRDVPLPVPSVADRPVYPALLDMSNDMVTVGAGLDRAALARENGQRVARAAERMLFALERDIEAHGGLLELVTAPGQAEGVRAEALTVLSVDEVLAKLTHANAYMASLERPATGVEAAAPAAGDAAVADACAVGINEYFLDTLALHAMPEPKNDCTDWANVLDAVRGRICWWTRIYSPEVDIDDATVSGHVRVDVGGAIEACVKKFWDCSWRWECGRLALAVRGKPGIRLELKEGNGIRFRARLLGGLRLESNLPFPFGKIVEVISAVVVSLVMAIVNMVVANIDVTIVPPEIGFGEQKTKLRLYDFDPFGYVSSESGLPENKTRYVGYAVGVDAGGG